MSEKTPVYLFITPDKNISPEEINVLTRELGQILEEESKNDPGQVKYVKRDSLPQGTKTVELLFAQQAIIELIPIVTPWILGKIDTAVKVISTRKQKAINVTVQVGAHEIPITPKTTSQELAQYQEIVKSAETIPSNRYALIIGSSTYSDKALPVLNSAEIDVNHFADVLRDPKLGAFSQVTTLINKDSHTILRSIENFFQNRQKEDLLLLYFSGHGVKTKLGQLFLATQNTIIDLIRSTGVSSDFIKENMDASSSQRQILILDCCYSGVIVAGAKSEEMIGQSVNSISAFQSSGFGRVIVTASDAMQFAFDGEQMEGHTQNSLFTRFLIEGLKTGKADTDNDGLVDVEELYHYAYSHVIPKQTPNKSATLQQGKLYISINPNPKIHPAELPEKLQAAKNSDDKYRKQGAIIELSLLLKNEDSRIAIAAEMALKELTTDDSLFISTMAKKALGQNEEVKPTGRGPTGGPDKKMVQKNEALGGVLNVILFGAGFAYADNWKKAGITFVCGMVALLIIGFLADSDLGILSGPLWLGGLVWLFLMGAKEVKQYNQRLIS